MSVLLFSIASFLSKEKTKKYPAVACRIWNGAISLLKRTFFLLSVSMVKDCYTLI
ncbi:hypothetical protein JCM6292_268 [Bacteroides pyogenes JCM 6292]|uniref:Uncharacterized protein n=1 Tax=Bacteroides pyogenes JCM 6292 TaxID=1235809 RepID=W4P4V4_9BACE|nr:hypothetical protein JCM6292_268 [Bacteroides pyogenes JCM 6292]